jgi:hypothetical protein
MPVPPPPRPKGPKFTIRALMIVIAATAIILSLLKPIAHLYRDVYPEVSRILERMASVDTAIVLTCLIIGVFVTLRLMGEDEKS